jgi:hypothetical protein
VRKTAKPTGVQPLRDAITTLLCVELEKLLGRSKLLKAPKPPPAVTGCVVLAAGGVALFLPRYLLPRCTRNHRGTVQLSLQHRPAPAFTR